MDHLEALLSGPVGELGFGGVAGAIVGYTAKKVTKMVALVTRTPLHRHPGTGVPAIW